MLAGTDFNTLTENSHKQVLNLIRVHREISGAEIARLTGFQPSTILYILRILDKKGYISVSRTGDSTQKGGKKPVLWKINPGVGLMLGIEVFKTKFRFVKLDFAGNIYSRGEELLSATFGLENGVPLLERFIRNTLSEEEVRKKSFLGIGIGMPGLVDSTQGSVQYSALLQMKDLQIGERLKKILGKPVYVVNDANAGALGISWYHNPVSEKLPKHIVYLTYNKESKNLGAGLIINHELYEGIAGTAGEIFDPLPGLDVLITTAVKKLGNDFPLMKAYENPADIPFKKLADHALDGCRLSAFAIEKICDLISEEIARITGLLNPNLIVIGGDITCRPELLNAYILPGCSRKTSKMLKMGYVLPVVCFSSFGEYSVAMGSTAMILSKILRIQNHKTR